MINSKTTIEAVRVVYDAILKETRDYIYRVYPPSYEIAIQHTNPHIIAAINLVIPGIVESYGRGGRRFPGLSKEYDISIIFKVSHEAAMISTERCHQLLDQYPDQWDELITEFILRG